MGSAPEGRGPRGTLTDRLSPHSQVDGPLEREGFGLLDVFIAELIDPAGPAGLGAVGRHDGHDAERSGLESTEHSASALSLALPQPARSCPPAKADAGTTRPHFRETIEGPGALPPSYLGHLNTIEIREE